MRNKIRSMARLMIFIILALSSCTNESEKFLSEAQRVVRSYPDSSLMLLDSISDPRSMSDRMYMEYVVTMVQAKCELGQDVTGDTIIYRAKEYFEEEDSPTDAALAYFYSGCVHKERREADKEIKDFLMAEEWASVTDDNELKGMIEYNLGCSFHKANLIDTALVRYKKSLAYYNLAGNRDSLNINIIKLIADSHMQNSEVDSGLFYYNLALDIAKHINGESYISPLLHRIGSSYANIGEYNNAKHYLFDALSLSENMIDSAQIYTHLLETYTLTQQYDSARVYGNIIENKYTSVLGNTVLYNVYGSLTRLSENLGDYKSALKYTQQGYECHLAQLSEDTSLEILNISRVHSLSQTEKQLLVLEYEMQEVMLVVAIILTFMFLVIALLLGKIAYDRSRQMKQKTDGLLAQTNNLQYLNKVYQSMRAVFVDFEKELDSLFVKYNIKEQLEGYKHIHARFKDMHKVAEESLCQPAVSYLKGQDLDESLFTILKSSDLVFLSLLMCGHKHKDIAIVLGVNTHTLQMRKSRLADKLRKNGSFEHLIFRYFS